MKHTLTCIFLTLACAGAALAGTNPAPEINPQSGAAALALLSGGLLVLRSRKSKKK